MAAPENAHSGPEKFDAYARSYDSVHQASVATSGEPIEYFAKYKLACLERIGAPLDEPVLDFGCGIGNLTEPLAGRFSEVHGYDPSAKSVEVAQKRVLRGQFHTQPSSIPESHFGTAVLAGVLHHVPRDNRSELLRTVRQKLRPGGRVVIFEHNPFNPLTRKAVADCPFDDDAVLLWPWELPRLLRSVGLRNVELEYIVFFPRALSFMRALEPKLKRVFIGAQTMTVGTR